MHLEVLSLMYAWVYTLMHTSILPEINEKARANSGQLGVTPSVLYEMSIKENGRCELVDSSGRKSECFKVSVLQIFVVTCEAMCDILCVVVKSW